MLADLYHPRDEDGVEDIKEPLSSRHNEGEKSN